MVNFDLVEVVRLLWRRKFLISLVSIASLSLALWIGFQLPRTYVAQGEVVVRAEASLAPDSEHAYYSSVVNEAVVATERDVLGAEGLLSRVASEVPFPPEMEKPSLLASGTRRLLSLLGVPTSEPPEESASDREERRVTFLKRATSTAVGKGSSVITVSAATIDPLFSQAIVNSLLRDYMKDRLVAQKAVAQNVEISLQERLKQTNEQIRATEERITSLMAQPGLVEGAEVPGAQRDLALIGSQLAQARLALTERQAGYSAVIALRDSARGDPGRLAELLDEGSVSTSDLRKAYVQKEQALASLSSRFGPEYPARVAALSEVDVLARRLTGEAMRVVEQRKAEMDAARRVVDDIMRQYDARRAGTSQQTDSVLRLSRERDALTNLHRVAGSIEDKLISVAAEPMDPNARVLTNAIAPQMAAYPNKKLLALLGGLVGLSLSSAHVLFTGLKRRLRRSALDQAALLSGRLLGSVPGFRSRSRRGWALLEELRQADMASSGQTAIAFQAIALELDDISHKTGCRVFAVTSAFPNEGKSMVATATGVSLAKMGRRVLLLQCDLYPRRRSYLSDRQRPSFVKDSVLPGVILDQGSALHMLELPVDPHPLEYLHSDKFRELLQIARRNYEIVLCDTPPVLSVPDGLLVTRMSDAVVLVSEFTQAVNLESAREFSRRIMATDTPVCGVVLTKLETNEVGYAAYLGYGPPPRERHALADAL